MKTGIAFLAFFLLIPAYLSGQSDLQNIYSEFLIAKRHNPHYWETVRGSAYEKTEFSESLIYFRHYKMPVKGMLKYNILFDEMEVMVEPGKDLMFLDKNEEVDSIIMDNQVYRFLPYNDGGKNGNGYLIEYVSGKYRLYLKKSREFQPEKKPASGFQDYVPASIIILPDKYYVQFGEDDVPQLLPASSKRIKVLFSDNGIDISEYVKSKKIKYNTESLIPLVSYCNTK